MQQYLCKHNHSMGENCSKVIHLVADPTPCLAISDSGTAMNDFLQTSFLTISGLRQIL